MVVIILMISLLLGNPTFAGNRPVKMLEERELLYVSKKQGGNRSNGQEHRDVVYTEVTLQDIEGDALLPPHLMVRYPLTDTHFTRLLSKLPSNQDLRLFFQNASELTHGSLKALRSSVEGNHLVSGLHYFLDSSHSLVFKELTLLNLSVTRKDTKVLRTLAPLFRELRLVGSVNLKSLKRASQLVSLDLREAQILSKKTGVLLRKLPALEEVILPEEFPKDEV